MTPRPGSQSRAALARDAALVRISRTRRWVIAGAAVLTAGFAALVSAVAPGRSLASKSQAGTDPATTSASTRGSTGRSSIPRMPPPANAGALGLQSPGQAPSADQSQPPADQSQPQSVPSAPPAPVAPQSSSGGGGGPVVSGGS
jgi:hypothetical protein